MAKECIGNCAKCELLADGLVDEIACPLGMLVKRTNGMSANHKEIIENQKTIIENQSVLAQQNTEIIEKLDKKRKTVTPIEVSDVALEENEPIN